jgi:hypothetical protein
MSCANHDILIALNSSCSPRQVALFQQSARLSATMSKLSGTCQPCLYVIAVFEVIYWCSLLHVQEAELFTSDLKELENIDDRGIKRVVAGLERRIRMNQELRMKHSDEPHRFLESEIALHEILRKLMALAGEPSLYTQLVRQGCLPLLLELLQHGNMDIVTAAVDLLKDLTEADSVEDIDEVCLQPLLCTRKGVVAQTLIFVGSCVLVTVV